MEGLTLPAPAGAVWRHAREVITEFFERPEQPDHGIVLGGGTILAARIGHRTSTDIDVKLTGEGALHTVLRDARALSRLDDALGAADLVRRRTQPPLQVVYGGHGGELDLFEGALSPPEPARWVDIDRTPVAVASNRQILTGKLLGRAVRAPVRDIIDIAVSAVADADACEKAINATQHDVRAALPTVWHQRNEEFIIALEDEEVRLSPDWDHLRTDPGGHAVTAIHDFAWRRVDIALDKRGATFTGRRPGTKQVLHDAPITSPNDIDSMYQALGVRYGMHPGTGLSYPATRLVEIMRYGGGETRIIKEVRLPGDPAEHEGEGTYADG